jgi:hypothetical protein
MSTRVSLSVKQRQIELWYGDSGSLELVQDVDGHYLIMQLSMSGSGVSVEDKNVMGGRAITGAMVALPELGIIVPYYVWRDIPSELVEKASS